MQWAKTFNELTGINKSTIGDEKKNVYGRADLACRVGRSGFFFFTFKYGPKNSENVKKSGIFSKFLKENIRIYFKKCSVKFMSKNG